MAKDLIDSGKAYAKYEEFRQATLDVVKAEV